MEIERYGIVLERLKAEHLNLVLEWRNAAHVRGHMEYQSLITSQQHVAWFGGVNGVDNLYFMIHYRNQYIGVVNAKEIDWKAGVAEAGIFIGDQQYLNDPASMLAVFTLMDFLFEVFGLNTLKAKISAANQNAISFNQKLGYQLLPDQSGQRFMHWEASRSDYFETAKALRKGAAKVFGAKGRIRLPEDSPFLHRITEKWGETLPEYWGIDSWIH